MKDPFTVRFRSVANTYPRQVALAYGQDLIATFLDSDEQVAAKVRGFEIANSTPPNDWAAIGKRERGE